VLGGAWVGSLWVARVWNSYSIPRVEISPGIYIREIIVKVSFLIFSFSNFDIAYKKETTWNEDSGTLFN